MQQQINTCNMNIYHKCQQKNWKIKDLQQEERDFSVKSWNVVEILATKNFISALVDEEILDSQLCAQIRWNDYARRTINWVYLKKLTCKNDSCTSATCCHMRRSFKEVKGDPIF